MTELFPAIGEADASGETAAIFADIRSTVGVRVVNLVWRHLATIDGALPWAWQAVRPLYLAGLPDQAARRFRHTMTPLRLSGLDSPQPTSVDAVLASYDHSNTINLFALGALIAWLREERDAGAPLLGGERLPVPDVALPKLATQQDVSAGTWGLVLRLNRFGDSPQPLILASMYRHLAHAPAFLARVEASLKPLHDSGALRRAIDVNLVLAIDLASRLAPSIVADRPRSADGIEASLTAFRDHAIGKMVTICRAIRMARA